MALLSIMGCGNREWDRQDTESDEQTLSYKETTGETETKLRYSVKEIPCDYSMKDGELSLLGLDLCILLNGRVYIYSDDEWSELEHTADIVKVYTGESFMALDCEGKIVVTEEEPDNYIGYPLSSAACLDGAWKFIRFAEDKKILKMSNNVFDGCFYVYFDDGHTLYVRDGEMVELSDSIKVADMSDGLILSEEGDVYERSRGRLEQISEKKYTAIHGYAGCYIGICEDGTTTIWSPYAAVKELTFDTKNPKAALMMRACGALLSEDGAVEFHSATGAIDYQVSKYFSNLNEKVLSFACAYQSIAFMTENGNLKILTYK